MAGAAASPCPAGRLNRPTCCGDAPWLIHPKPSSCGRLPGQTVQRLSRRAKLIQIHLDRDTLLIHLRMSGDLRVEPISADMQKHDRLLLNFTDGLRLAFNDTRKFGRVWLTDDPAALTSQSGPGAAG